MQKKLKKKFNIKFKKRPSEPLSFKKEKEQKRGQGFQFVIRDKEK